MNYTKIVFCMKLQQKNQKEKDFIEIILEIIFQGGIYESGYLFEHSSNKYIF